MFLWQNEGISEDTDRNPGTDPEPAGVLRPARLVNAPVSLPSRLPVPSGSLWRLHCSVGLLSLTCDFFKLTGVEGSGTGESLAQFPVRGEVDVVAVQAYRGREERLETYASPRIGRMPVSDVTSADMLEILTPIWHVKATMARRVRQRIRAVMEWAIAMQMRTDNPCDRLEPVLGVQQAVVEHMRALPRREAAAAVSAGRASRATPAGKLAVEFLVLTAPPLYLHNPLYYSHLRCVAGVRSPHGTPH